MNTQKPIIGNITKTDILAFFYFYFWMLLTCAIIIAIGIGLFVAGAAGWVFIIEHSDWLFSNIHN